MLNPVIIIQRISNAKNWRTTLFGVLSAAAYAAYTYYEQGGIKWQEALGAVAVAVFGYLVGDGKTAKPGGTEENKETKP